MNASEKGLGGDHRNGLNTQALIRRFTAMGASLIALRNDFPMN